MVQGNPQIFSLWEELRPARFKINTKILLSFQINDLHLRHGIDIENKTPSKRNSKQAAS